MNRTVHTYDGAGNLQSTRTETVEDPSEHVEFAGQAAFSDDPTDDRKVYATIERGGSDFFTGGLALYKFKDANSVPVERFRLIPVAAGDSVLCHVAVPTSARFHLWCGGAIVLESSTGHYELEGPPGTLNVTGYEGASTNTQVIRFPNSVALMTKAGAPTDADWGVTPPDGTAVVDETNSLLYVRVNGVWKSTALS